MYLSRLKLTNIRQLHGLDLSFLSDEGVPRMWNILLGDNGVGKSTILRCVAIGVCDQSSAAGLVRELRGGLSRSDDTNGVILVELRDREGSHWTIETRLHTLKKTGEQVKQAIYNATIEQVEKRRPKEVDDFAWEDVFVVAYGAGRGPDGREEYDEYRTIDAVYTLFRYDQPLQSAELVWRRLLDVAREGHNTARMSKIAADQVNVRIVDVLSRVLLLDGEERIELTGTGIRVTVPGGTTIPLSAHADGYKATTTWVLDLIAWSMLYQRLLNPSEITGVVLIDEIEQHLHPRWQRELVGRLAIQFPKVQFVVTTHSPLCAGGAADLDESNCQLTALRRTNGRIAQQLLPAPRGLRADQLLTSDAFGLPSTINPRDAADLEEFRTLLTKSRLGSKQKERLSELRRELEMFVPGPAETEADRAATQLLYDQLEKLQRLLEEAAKKDDSDNEA